VALATLALPALAAPGSLLEITVGPHETSWLEPKELKVRLDGVPLAVAVPPAKLDPGQPIYSDVVKPGSHRVEVEASFVGNSEAFSYLQGYVFRMSGQLDIDAPVGEAVGVNLKVVKRSGLTVEWTQKFKLALNAGRYTSGRAATAQVPDAAPPAAATAAAGPRKPEVPAAQPVPVAFVKRQGAGACTLEPARFAFGKHGLDAASRARLDRFAKCLRESGDAVVIAGHSDPRGTRQYNEWLSAERASEVVDYLIRRGVDRSRLATMAYGSSHLLCREATEDCQARNRRAEAIVSVP
jgi:outer membrane protein OmpA-like peptidoglycan-associated protein